MPRKKLPISIANGEPLMSMYAEGSEETTSRRNRGATIERTDKYSNIDAAPLPFKYSVGFQGNQIDARWTTLLVQKAYFNISVVRNIIDLMTEFSVGNLYFRDGNDTSRSFIGAWWNKINGHSVQDRFYRGYYREGNVFYYRFEGDLQDGDIRRIISTFGLEEAQGLSQLEVPPMKLPIRYVMLNPADILFAGSISFYAGSYYKRLNEYEIQRLRNPQSDEDQEVLNTLPEDIKKQILSGDAMSATLPLSPDKVAIIFYKKQDFEPFSAPMIYPVLEDLNAKLELKRLDMAIARTQQQVILLITTGNEPDKGGINDKNIVALQKLFANESIGRVLVADYTTKAEFVIPNIGDILTPDKYEELDKDINLGLNNILVGGEKFANQTTKTEVFLARLEHGRNVFLNEFLIPEIRRICKSLGFKNVPTPYYEDIKLKNNDARDKLFVRLAELGLLTPGETFTAIDSGRLPDSSQNKTDQQAYKADRDKGLYQPLLGKPQDGEGMTGRPDGTSGSPQTTKKISPIGTSSASDNYSLSKLSDYMKKSRDLGNEVAALLQLQFKKKKLTKEQTAVAAEITKVIIANEDPDNWSAKINDYVKNPVDTNPERIREIQAIGAEYGFDDYLSSLLYLCKIPQK